MTNPSHKISLIVDRQFGSRIREVATTTIAWVVESPTNNRFIGAFWDDQRAGRLKVMGDAGVTSFEAKELETAEDTCERILFEIEDHHGYYATDTPWLEIDVVGAEGNTRLRRVAEQLGATSIERTKDGFTIRRSRAIP